MLEHRRSSLNTLNALKLYFSFFPHLRQNRALAGFFSWQEGHDTGSLPVVSLIFSRAVLKALSISLPAIENAFSISSPVLWNASLKSSVTVEIPASTPFFVLKPHIGQKYAFSGSSSPHFEQ